MGPASSDDSAAECRSSRAAAKVAKEQVRFLNQKMPPRGQSRCLPVSRGNAGFCEDRCLESLSCILNNPTDCVLSPVSDYVAYLIRERNVSYSPTKPCGGVLNHAVVARGDWIATWPMDPRPWVYWIEQVNGRFAITTNEVLRMPATISVPPQKLLER